MKTLKKQQDLLPRLLRLYPTFKEWKPTQLSRSPPSRSLVYILPLRNENYLSRGILYLGKPVYILPLRNENRSCSFTNLKNSLSLYPTFKEWKPSGHRWPPMTTNRLYPTFKEWKRTMYIAASNDSSRFISYL